MVYFAGAHVAKTLSELHLLLPENERSKPQIILLVGEVTPFRNDTDREMPFRQESNFFYLTGCEVSGSFLVVSPSSGTQLPTKSAQSRLFIPKAELADMMWSVPPPACDEAVETYDVTTVSYISDLPATLQSLTGIFPDALFHTLPRGSKLFPTLDEEYVQTVLSSAECGVTDAYLLPALHRARLVKDEQEIELIRRANEISSRAHEVVMRVLGKAAKGLIQREPGSAEKRPLLPGEWTIEKESEAEAIFVASCRREGAVHQAYLPIVASSHRSATLHYCCNDKEFAWGPVPSHGESQLDHSLRAQSKEIHPQLLLIDAGCELSCYASDITRTTPLGNGGRFTSTSKGIYELVLKMQQTAMEMIKPGVHWDKVHLTTHRVLVEGFLELGIFKDGSASEILKSGISAPFCPHGLGHSLGMDVHDVPSVSKPLKNDTIPKDDEGHPDLYAYLRLRIPLEAGMVLTVEPGIYFHQHLLAPVLVPESGTPSPYLNMSVLQKYLDMGGVRIEDDVLVTKNGYENLTTVDSSVERVEGLCSGEIV